MKSINDRPDSGSDQTAAKDRRRRLKVLVGLVPAIIIALAGLGAAPQAEAATACPVSQFCYYYSANMQGSMKGYRGTVQVLAETFESAGAGQGQAVRNNAHSVCNNTNQQVKVYVYPSFYGDYQTIPAYTCTNLNRPVLNNEASHQFVTSTNYTCLSNSFCYYYGANMTGSAVAFSAYDVPVMTSYFVVQAAGVGTPVRNNAHSVCNKLSRYVDVFEYTNYGGRYDRIAPGECRNLTAALVNNNASHKIR